MKTFLFVTSAILLGAALGSGVAVWRFKSVTWDRKLDESIETKPAAAARREPAPKATVDAADHNFGTVVNGTELRHDFVFLNRGDAPLTLADGGAAGGDSIDLKIERSQLPAGASGKVTAAWSPTDKPGSTQDTVDVLTNDPSQPRITLTLSGEMIDPLKFVTPELKFSRLSISATAAAQTQLLCYVQQPLKILGHQWSDEATARYFDLTLQPLSENELKKDRSAQSGFVVKVTVKPGLPSGALQQTLVLKTNVASSPTVSLPLQGVVASDITVVGHDWDSETSVVDLGHVAASKGLKRTVMLVVRGPSRHDVRFDIAEVAPKFIKVDLGHVREINDGTVVEVPLIIEIPSGSPPSVYLGSRQGELGEIILQTTHPQVPKFRLRLRFAIEG